MEKLFIPYELAIIAKEKGFNEKCLAYFPAINNLHQVPSLGYYGSPPNETLVIAPVYQQIIDWFRDKHAIVISAKLYAVGSSRSLLYIPQTLYIKNDGNSMYGDACKDANVSEHTYDYYCSLNMAIEEGFKLL